MRSSALPGVWGQLYVNCSPILDPGGKLKIAFAAEQPMKELENLTEF